MCFMIFRPSYVNFYSRVVFAAPFWHILAHVFSVGFNDLEAPIAAFVAGDREV